MKHLESDRILLKMDVLRQCFVCLVIVSFLQLVSGNRDLETEFDALLSKFDEMKVSYQEEITKLREENGDLRRIYKELRENHENLKRDHENLRRNYDELKRDEEDLTQNYNNLKQNHKDDMLELRKDFSYNLNKLTKQFNDTYTNKPGNSKPSKDIRQLGLQNGNKKIDTRALKVGKLLNPMVIDSADHSGRVAFYTFLSKDVGDLASNEILVFDKVVTNVGNLYNSAGVFTCDLPGTFVFHVHVVAEPQNIVFLAIWQNNSTVAQMYAEKQGGATAILQLNQGDTVTVRSGNRTQGKNSIDVVHTTFSGFLLYAGDI